VTAAELENLLMENGVTCMGHFADSSYNVTTQSFINGTFSEAWFRLMNGLGLSYKAESYDCDDFAKLAAAYAQILHGRTHRDSGLAFGEFWYSRGSGGKHAINVAVVYGGKYELLFFEPQNCKQVRLSKQEIQSCQFVRF